MTNERRGNPAPPDRIQSMFDRIAPVYDVMNTLMTAGLDARWRREAVAASRLAPGGRAIDVACGTGRLTEALADTAGSGGEVVGVDVAREMLRRARAWSLRRHAGEAGAGGMPTYREADALALPFADGAFDVATIGFGLRNMPDYAAALREMARVVRPGGRVVVLEIAIPSGGLAGVLFAWWFRRAIPLLGRIAGRRSAYRYLPASLLDYPAPGAIGELMGSVGLTDVGWRRLASQMATLHVGRVPET